ncbi:MAG: alpha/beta hydrolase [Oscillospiraceae bacterium]|jgi:pimeloyl-ACP methyl ester carboxylesterase|nr:alpha/beta hydrolase [Oscillospiraceae bacterium]
MFVEARGVNVHYEQSGRQGPDVLLLHGWGCDISLWRPIIERLSQRCRVTTLDFPGHGGSERPPEPWDAKAFAAMTAEFIEKLGIAGCCVIGHSHGGRVALRLALDRPELIGKLILTGSAGLRSKPTLKRRARSVLYKILRGTLDGLEKLRIFGGMPERARAALRGAFGSADYKALDEDMRRTFVLLVNTNLEPELPNVRASTLLLWGDKDTETPLWMGRLMAERIPDAGLVVLEGGSHFAYIEQPDRFCRIAARFILD